MAVKYLWYLCCYTGEPCWSFIAHNVDEVEKFFKETIENRLVKTLIYYFQFFRPSYMAIFEAVIYNMAVFCRITWFQCP